MSELSVTIDTLLKVIGLIYMLAGTYFTIAGDTKRATLFIAWAVMCQVTTL